MSKLISNPTECGYCNIEENYRDIVCKHPKNAGGDCFGFTFPDTCPLQDGITIEQCKESPIEMVDRLLKSGTQTIRESHSHEILVVRRKSKPKRRNRRNCIHHRIPIGSRSLSCRSKDRISPNCIGVNCGYFKSKNNE